jgi:hypothetical protein
MIWCIASRRGGDDLREVSAVKLWKRGGFREQGSEHAAGAGIEGAIDEDRLVMASLPGVLAYS